MIADLKHDELINKYGGRFQLTALIQKRWRQLMQGARPMIDAENLTDLEVVVKEIMEGKVTVDDQPAAAEEE